MCRSGKRSCVSRATRCATPGSWLRSSVKCRELPSLTHAVMRAQRSRIVAGERSNTTDSTKLAPLGLRELHAVGHLAGGVVAGGDLRLDLDARIGRHQRVGNLHALADLDAAADDGVVLDVAH